MTKDRFDLEQAIMNAWATSEDLDLVYHNTDNLNLSAKDCDTLQNQMLGLKYLFELRMEKVWDVFESCIKQDLFDDRDKISAADIDQALDYIDNNRFSPELEAAAVKADEVYYDPMA